MSNPTIRRLFAVFCYYQATLWHWLAGELDPAFMRQVQRVSVMSEPAVDPDDTQPAPSIKDDEDTEPLPAGMWRKVERRPIDYYLGES